MTQDAENARRIAREARLSASLRENLKRRKAQARSRSAAAHPAERETAGEPAASVGVPDGDKS
jgi:hypothetical protein